MDQMTDLASDCDTDSDVSDIDGEIEESNSDISHGSVDEIDYDQVDANTATVETTVLRGTMNVK